MDKTVPNPTLPFREGESQMKNPQGVKPAGLG
jgi:hypothetical protein